VRDDGDGATVRRYGDPMLRRRCLPAEPGAASAAVVADRLWATLAVRDGVGLSAPQIGETTRIVVASIPPRRGGARRLEMFNPEIVKTFGPEESFEEGCLSFPGIYVDIRRPRGAEIRYRDRDGAERILRDEGLLARVLQHEIDHLDGVLFVDRMPRLRRMLLAGRLGWLRLASLLQRRSA
jgi:peptide deformylase